jgi:hypothetical protein
VGDSGGLGLSGQGQSRDQLPRKRVVSRVSRTFSVDEWQGAKARDQSVKVAAAIARVQVMSDAEMAEKKDPALRLPRQAEHYSQIVGHFLAVKNSREIAGAIEAHFERLQKYHQQLLGLAVEVEGDSGKD